MQGIMALMQQDGKYIAFVDSDDFIHNEYVQTLYELCIRYNCDIAECNFENWNNSENTKIEQPEKKEQIYSSKEKLKRIYGAQHIRSIVAWNKLYKAELFKKIRYPVGKLNEDQFTTYKLFDTVDSVVETNQKLYYYCYSPDSIMRKKFNIKRLDYIEALEQRMQYFEEKNEHELYELTKCKYCYVLMEFYHKTKKDIKYSEEIQKELWSKLSKALSGIWGLKNICIKDKGKILFGFFFPKTYCKKYLKI